MTHSNRLSPTGSNSPTNYVTQDELQLVTEEVNQILNFMQEEIHNLKEQQMATQADIDAVTAALTAEDSELNTAVSGLNTSVTNIQALIAQLQQQNPQLDLTALQAELQNSQTQATNIQTAVQSAASLVPAPTPAPASGRRNR